MNSTDADVRGRLGCLMRNGFRSTHLDFHLNTRPEAADDRHEAIQSKTARDLHCECARSPPPRCRLAMRFTHAQLDPVERFDDFGGQDGLELLPSAFSHPVRDKHFRCPALGSSSPHLRQSLQPVLDQLDLAVRCLIPLVTTPEKLVVSKQAGYVPRFLALGQSSHKSSGLFVQHHRYTHSDRTAFIAGAG